MPNTRPNAKQITNLATGGLTTTNVQDSLADLDSRISGSLYVNVKSFGATGNGTTDDTAAIQAAINSVASTLGGTVFFPTGTYKITATINVPVVSGGATNTVLLGAGYSSIIKATASMTAMVFIAGSLTTVDSITFQANAVATRAIQLGNTGVAPGLPQIGQNITIQNCKFEVCPVAIYVWKFIGMTIFNNYFLGCTTSVYGADTTMDSRIVDNYIQGGGPCLYFTQGVGGTHAEGILIQGNTIFANGSNSGSAIVFNGGLELKILDNVIGEITNYPGPVNAYGLELIGSPNSIAYVQVSNNWFGSATSGGTPLSYAGIIVSGNSQGVRINNNTFNSFGNYGVFLNGASVSTCSVSDNVFTLNKVSDIEISGALNCIVKQNVLKADGNIGTTNTINESASSQIIATENVFYNKLPNVGSKSLYKDNFGWDVTATMNSSKRGLRGALIRATAPQNIPTGAISTQVTFGATEYDTDGVVSGNTFVTPTWATRVRLTAAVLFSNTSSAGDRTIAVQKNGTFGYNYQPNCVSTGNGAGNIWHNPTLHSAWIPTTYGDIWSLYAGQTSGGTLATDAALIGTWFCVEFM